MKRNPQRHRQLAVQQLLRTLAVALIDLTQPAAAASALCVDRLDELHQIPAVMALQHLLIVLTRQTHAVAREMIDLDIRNITHKRLSLLPRDDRAHENRRIHRNIDGLRARNGRQRVILPIRFILEGRRLDLVHAAYAARTVNDIVPRLIHDKPPRSNTK